jgi:hypothetical protein
MLGKRDEHLHRLRAQVHDSLSQSHPIQAGLDEPSADAELVRGHDPLARAPTR